MPLTAPISLYLHIPFCIHKCSYCDFFSLGVGQQLIPGEQYMARLTDELHTMAERLGVRGRGLASIFFGGGTPSMIAPHLLGAFLEAVQRIFTAPADLEITCEANPETVDVTRLRELRAAGVNRLSVGIQSFQPHHLQFLERVHSAGRAIAAVRDVHTAGFTNINADLIFALPQQTMAELDADLSQLLALETTHLSCYQLTVEPHTPLAAQVAQGRVQMPDDECAHAMWQHVRARLDAAGFASYEVSNYARAGFTCVHNRHYWRFGDYLGLGAGAVSRVGNHRWRRARHLKKYLAGELAVDETEQLTLEARRLEYGMLALRTREGIALDDFAARFGVAFDAAYPGLRAQWCADVLAETGATHLRLTPRGLSLLDTLAAAL